MPERRPRRTDPGRRDRIVDACLDVVAEHGVAGTTHRRVAAAADVPLGSTTYHFAGLDELLREAFTRFAQTVSDEFERRLGAAPDADTARAAVVGLICGAAGTRRDLVLTHELYTLAAREPAFRDLTHAWMALSRRALEHHFDPTTARMLDALIEGLAVHRALDRPGGQGPYDEALVADAVARITRA